MSPDRELQPTKRPDLAEERAAFEEFIVGQDQAVASFARLVARIRTGIRSSRPGPIDVKFLAGPSGVGKTAMVYRFAEVLAETDPDLDQGNPREKVIRINCGEYQSSHEIAKLIGAPPGYRDSDNPNAKAESGLKPVFSPENLDASRIYLRNKDGSEDSVIVVLVDEAEKASKSFHQMFLSILDAGHLVLGNNTAVSFGNAVVFYTSNLGNKAIDDLRDTIKNRFNPQDDLSMVFLEAFDKDELVQGSKRIVKEAFIKQFTPEFRGRIRELIVFNLLEKEQLGEIVGVMVREVAEDLYQSLAINSIINISEDAICWIIEHAYNPSEGARPLENMIDVCVKEQILLIASEDPDAFNNKSIYVDLSEDGADLEILTGDENEVLEAENRKANAAILDYQDVDTMQDSPEDYGL